MFINRNEPSWRDAAAYGSHKRLYSRGRCWDEAGVFARMREGLAALDAEPKIVIIDAPGADM